MASCCNTPLARIEKIKENQIMDPVINPDASPYDELPEFNTEYTAPVLTPEQMTSLVRLETDLKRPPINPPTPNPDGSIPDIIADSPTFHVPRNPLLPPGYREVLNYNALQYINGFYRTQIGRYVQVTQLVGSNTTETLEGYLTAVSVNYIVLQELATGNITIIDSYSIKSMYVYYNIRTMPPGSHSPENPVPRPLALEMDEGADI